jgi:DNA-binding NarL/FixJ family response regulator
LGSAANIRPGASSGALAAPTRVLILEDQLPTRVGLRLALRSAEFELVAEVADPAEAAEVARQTQPDICLVDGDLNGDAITVVREVKQALPKARILVLSSADPGSALGGVLLAFEAGACGWLRKDVSPARLPSLLRAVRDGETVVPRSVVGALMEDAVEQGRLAYGAASTANGKPPQALNDARLTRRDSQVLELLARGKSTSAIAAELGISAVTVRRHLSNATRKLGVANRAEAVRIVQERSINSAERSTATGRTAH